MAYSRTGSGHIREERDSVDVSPFLARMTAKGLACVGLSGFRCFFCFSLEGLNKIFTLPFYVAAVAEIRYPGNKMRCQVGRETFRS
jgi:hypothetical protein